MDEFSDAEPALANPEVEKAFYSLYGRGVLNGAMYDKLMAEHNERLRQTVADEVWR